MRDAFRLLLFTPVKKDFPQPLQRDLNDDEQKTADQIGKVCSAEEGQVIVLFGPWGSGKSTLISSMIEKGMNPFNNCCIKHRVSMHIASNMNEAFLCLIPTWVKLVTLFLVSICLIGAHFYIFKLDVFIKSIESSSTATAIALGIFSIFILINAQRSVYILCGVIESTVSSIFSFKQIKIIEDFDRSSLDKDGILACLASRVTANSTYIIPIGYNSVDEQIEYLDVMKKLNAAIITLEVNSDNLLKVAQELDHNIKFKHSKWLRIFTYREVVTIVNMCNKLSYELESKMIRYSYYRIFFYAILQKFKLSEHHISFSSGSISNNRISSADAHGVLADFIQSLDINDIKIESGFQNGAANWNDIMLRELLFGHGHFQDVQRFLC